MYENEGSPSTSPSILNKDLVISIDLTICLMLLLHFISKNKRLMQFYT
jgi:hypothetical protein